VFLHLILTANYEPKQWHGITIQRGQRVFSYVKLAKEIHMPVQQARTAINHLKSTGEITCIATAEYSIVTIKNYDLYQQPTCELTYDQHATNMPSTCDQHQLKKAKESNKAINKKNIYSAIFSEYAAGDLELLKALNDFAEMRKQKKKPLTTDRAVKMLLSSLDKLASDSKDKIAILNQSVFYNWAGVFPLKGENENGGFTNKSGNNGARTGGGAAEVPTYGKVY
jgi:hypothetical protein